jgi:hypothetical protein
MLPSFGSEKSAPRSLQSASELTPVVKGLLTEEVGVGGLIVFALK